MDALGVRRPDVITRVVEYIPQASGGAAIARPAQCAAAASLQQLLPARGQLAPDSCRAALLPILKEGMCSYNSAAVAHRLASIVYKAHAQHTQTAHKPFADHLLCAAHH